MLKCTYMREEKGDAVTWPWRDAAPARTKPAEERDSHFPGLAREYDWASTSTAAQWS